MSVAEDCLSPVGSFHGCQRVHFLNSIPQRICLRFQPLKNSAGRVPQATDGTCEKNHKSDRVGRRGLSEPGGIFSRLPSYAFLWLYLGLYLGLYMGLYPGLYPWLYPGLRQETHNGILLLPKRTQRSQRSISRSHMINNWRGVIFTKLHSRLKQNQRRRIPWLMNEFIRNFC